MKLMVGTIVVAAAFGAATLAQTEPDIKNPYELYYAEVVKIIDGDTLEVRVDLWPGLVTEYSVRVRGVDSPELRGANCPEEKIWAEQAKAQVEKAVRHRVHDPAGGRRL